MLDEGEAASKPLPLYYKSLPNVLLVIKACVCAFVATACIIVVFSSPSIRGLLFRCGGLLFTFYVASAITVYCASLVECIQGWRNIVTRPSQIQRHQHDVAVHMHKETKRSAEFEASYRNSLRELYRRPSRSWARTTFIQRLRRWVGRHVLNRLKPKQLIYLFSLWIRICTFIAGAACTALLLAATIVLVMLVQQHSTITSGRVAVPQNSGLISPVSIGREDNGVVHIDASNEADLFFAQGFAVAQDRILQLEVLRRASRGRLAEVFGREALKFDIFARTMGFAAKQANISANARAAAERYAAGISSYLASSEVRRFPLDFKLLGLPFPGPFTLQDIIAIDNLLAWSFSSNWQFEIARYRLQQNGASVQNALRLLPPFLSRNSPLVIPQDALVQTNSIQEHDSAKDGFVPSRVEQNQILASAMESVTRTRFYKHMFSSQSVLTSSSFAIGKSLSQSGESMIASDLHSQLDPPPPMHLVHLRCNQSSIDVIGSAFVGITGIVSGKNEKIAWGMSYSLVDTADLFAMKSVDGKEGMYEHNEELHEYEAEKSTISVLGDQDYEFKIERSVYGPVVNEIFGITGDKASMNWTGFASSGSIFDASIALDKAKSRDEFVAASRLSSVPYGLVFVDSGGHLGFVLAGAGSLPKRGGGCNGLVPSLGDGSCDWQSFDEVDDVTTFDSKDPFIIAANNRILQAGAELQLGMDFVGLRAQRLHDVLSGFAAQNKTLSFDNVQSLLVDKKNLLLDRLRSVFVSLTLRADVPAEAQKWAQQLSVWDGSYNLASEESPVFEAFLARFRTDVLVPLTHADELLRTVGGELMVQVLASRSDFWDQQCATLASPDRPIRSSLEAAKYAFIDGIQDLKTAFHGLIPRWSDASVASMSYFPIFASPFSCFACREFSSNAGTSLLDYASFDPNSRGWMRFDFGSGFRQTMSTDERSHFSLFMGNTENWMDYHYDSLHDSWENGRGIAMNRSMALVSSVLWLDPRS